MPKKYLVLRGLNIVKNPDNDPLGERFEPGETITEKDLLHSAAALIKNGTLQPAHEPEESPEESPEEELNE